MLWWKYFIRVFWGPRLATVEQCAESLSQCVSRLAASSPRLAGWAMDLGGVPLPLDRDSITESLLKSRSRDDSGEVIGELGYKLTLHCGHTTDDWIMMTTSCGAYSSSPGAGNSCLLFLPGSDDVHRDLLATNRLARVLSEMANCWDADWGMVSTGEFDAARPSPNPRTPRGGWVVYLSRRLLTQRSMPRQCKKLDVDPVGATFLLVEEALDVCRKDHLESIDAFTQWIQRE
jgi:hypothetical protein